MKYIVFRTKMTDFSLTLTDLYYYLYALFFTWFGWMFSYMAHVDDINLVRFIVELGVLMIGSGLGVGIILASFWIIKKMIIWFNKLRRKKCPQVY